VTFDSSFRRSISLTCHKDFSPSNFSKSALSCMPAVFYCHRFFHPSYTEAQALIFHYPRFHPQRALREQTLKELIDVSFVQREKVKGADGHGTKRHLTKNRIPAYSIVTRRLWIALSICCLTTFSASSGSCFSRASMIFACSARLFWIHSCERPM